MKKNGLDQAEFLQCKEDFRAQGKGYYSWPKILERQNKQCERDAKHSEPGLIDWALASLVLVLGAVCYLGWNSGLWG